MLVTSVQHGVPWAYEVNSGMRRSYAAGRLGAEAPSLPATRDQWSVTALRASTMPVPQMLFSAAVPTQVAV